MADSERPQERDDEVPDPQNQGDPLDKTGRGDEVADQGPQEPDRGIASWQSWIRLVVEVVLPLANQILGLINGNGG